MTTATTIRTLVLVEGESDAAAVRALADLIGCDLGSHPIQIWSANGVTNFSRVLVEFVRTHPGADFCGMYDVADEWHIRRALADAAIPTVPHESLESFGFFACVADLEDELIRALGTEAVVGVLEAQAELNSFRRFQAMPQHRSAPVHRQLHRFLGTRATRKIRCARRLVEFLDLARLPHPLVQLAARLLEAASQVPRRSDAVSTHRRGGTGIHELTRTIQID
jgi:OLD-like protein